MKKSQALASALHEQGHTAGAVAHLGSSIALLTSLGISARESLEPLVQSLVTFRAGLCGSSGAEASAKMSSRSGLSMCDYAISDVLHNAELPCAVSSVPEKGQHIQLMK